MRVQPNLKKTPNHYSLSEEYHDDGHKKEEKYETELLIEVYLANAGNPFFFYEIEGFLPGETTAKDSPLTFGTWSLDVVLANLIYHNAISQARMIMASSNLCHHGSNWVKNEYQLFSVA